MESLTLKTIAEWCQGRLNDAPGLVVDSVSTDSRAIKGGELFIALSGEKFDAHNFLAEVASRGAAAVIVEESRAGLVPEGLPAITVDNTRSALGRLARKYRE